MDSVYATSMGDEDEGPIIQEIPDALMVGDYIEIHGICRGPEIIVQLLSRKDPNVLPLHVRVATGGPVLVKSQSREKLDRQEHNVRMGLQPNMDFELCIYAREDGYEVKLNKQTVCLQKHLIKLEDVSAISMDGDADFTSVEFKDIYGDEEDEDQYTVAAPGPGMMRVQEMRESFSRQRGSPVLIRSSIRKSQRSNQEVNAVKQPWSTSADLSRPDHDVDLVREANVKDSVTVNNQSQINAPIPVEMRASVNTPSPKSKSRFSWKPGNRKSYSMEDEKILSSPHIGDRIVAGETHAGTFRNIDDTYANPRNSASLATLNASSGSLADPQKKKRSSLFGKLRKSKGSEPDVSVEGSEKRKKKGLKNPFKSKKSINLTPLGESRYSASMPDVAVRESGDFSRMSAATGPSSSRYLGAAADQAPVRGPVPKSVCKEPAPEIAGYLAAQKAVPDFEEFTLTDRNSHELSSIALATAPTTARAPSYTGSTSERKLKGPAPELADILLDSNRATFDQTTTLTCGQPSMSADYSVQESTYVEPFSTNAPPAKLKGPAPEVASLLENGRYPGDTNLLIEMSSERPTTQYSSAPPMDHTTPSHVKPAKLKGPAPEVASELYSRHSGTLSLVPDATLTGGEIKQKQPQAVIERPAIDRDPVHTKPISITPNYQSQPVYASRPVSVGRKDSDVSSVQSDGEYYLEVGKSSYYFERMRSLKNYRSRRSRKSDQYGRESGESSTRSSISSLKADDRVIYPSKSLQDKSWLNGYSTESDLYQPTPSRPKVYAAAPVASRSPEPIDLTMDKEELRQSNNSAEIPLALTPGRSAVICGHFLSSNESQQTCFIQLHSTEANNLLLEFTPEGSLTLDLVKNNTRHNYARHISANNSEMNGDKGQFTIRLHARETYLGVTLNNDFSVIVRAGLDPCLFERIELLSGSCAELDYFAVASELTIPIRLTYPTEVVTDEFIQKLTLQIRSDADAAKILLDFETENGDKFTLTLELADGFIFASGCLGETDRQIIPFVPEQIHQLIISKDVTTDSLIVMANQKVIFHQPLPIYQPYDKLKKVRLSGDMMLLGTQFE